MRRRGLIPVRYYNRLSSGTSDIHIFILKRRYFRVPFFDMPLHSNKITLSVIHTFPLIRYINKGKEVIFST